MKSSSIPLLSGKTVKDLLRVESGFFFFFFWYTERYIDKKRALKKASASTTCSPITEEIVPSWLISSSNNLRATPAYATERTCVRCAHSAAQPGGPVKRKRKENGDTFCASAAAAAAASAVACLLRTVSVTGSGDTFGRVSSLAHRIGLIRVSGPSSLHSVPLCAHIILLFKIAHFGNGFVVDRAPDFAW